MVRLVWRQSVEPRRSRGGGRADTTADTRPGEWSEVTLNSLRQVEDLFDLLEAHGVGERQFVVLGDALFLVRWR